MGDHRITRLHRTLSSVETSRGFRRYFLAQFASNVGTRLQMAATAWLVLEMTGSSLQMGLILAAEVVPILVLAPIAGRLVDHYSARRIAIITQSLLATIVFGFVLAGAAGSYVMIVVLSILFGSIAAFDGVARQTLVVELVPAEALQSAFSLNAVSANGSAFIGPAIAGVLIAAVGAPWCFALNAVTFIAVAVVIGTLPASAGQGNRESAPGASFVASLKYVCVVPILLASLLSVALVSALTYEFPITLPLLVSEEYGDAATSYGLLLAASGLGAIAGGLKTAGDNPDSRKALPLAALGLSLGVVAIAFTGNVWWGVAALFVTGAFSTRFLALASTRVFAHVPGYMRGRVSSLWQIATVGTTVVGGPLVGALADAHGARVALLVGAGAAFAGAGIAFLGVRGNGKTAVQTIESELSHG